MTAMTVRTFKELAAAMRNAPPPSDDDVTILEDGRRIDSKDAALQWLAEVQVRRDANERAAADVHT